MMNKEYRKKIENIKVDGENYANEEMKPVYKDQKETLDKIHTAIGVLFIAYAIDGLLKLSTIQKTKVKSDFDKVLKDMGLNLGKKEVDTVKNILSNVYKDTFYKNIYTLESGMAVNLKFNILKKEFVNAAVNAKYKGELFSDRIWLNKSDMIDALQKNITSAMKGDITIDKIGRQIRDTFNVTAYESQRLVNTETARVQTQASEDMARATGVEQVMWSATLDMLTAPEDADLDGKVWGIDEDHPEPPLHPNCRCALINVPYEGWQPTQRKDNETKEVIDYENYADWAKNKGIGGDSNE
jgi:SPP1 gp7 family putative phage head morphogenesis protein